MLTRRQALLAGASILAAQGRAEAATGWQRAWPETDFDRTVVPLGEIMSGGVPRDGIPAITGPRMIEAASETRISAREPVMTLEVAGADPRAYPLRYLTGHEIVNDIVAGQPVAVTFCPLCNSGLVFGRTLDGQTLEFGVSGLLRNSDMIMYDRQTHSLWQQFTGAAIVGRLTGAQLPILVSWMEAWESFASRNPAGRVMDQPAGHRRDYGRNPYVGYDGSAQPLLYRGEDPPHGIAPLAYVLRVGDRAWPLARLREAGMLREAGLEIVWETGMASALDSARIADGRDIGQIRVRDAASGADIAHEVVFAFAFHAFETDGIWMLGQ